MLLLLAAGQEPGGLQIFLQQAINGLITGSLFALIALGYSMVYGIIELINFAHGDIFMLGAFLSVVFLGGIMGQTGAVDRKSTRLNSSH